MDPQISRRRFLQIGATSSSIGLAGCNSWAASQGDGTKRTASGSTTSSNESASNPDAVDVRGAIYIPSRAFNRYQMWREYDPAVIERDLGYAASLNLNAIRTWLSYEFWLEDRDAHEERLEHFLETAEAYGLRVLLGLFDSIGEEPTFENLYDTGLLTGVQTFSPSTRTMLDKQLWDTPREFIRWFMTRYGSDERLLAIELSNEPGWRKSSRKFVEAMAKVLTLYRGSVPLTMGSTSLANNAEYLDWGMDILQFHYNFVKKPSLFRRVLQQAALTKVQQESQVWLSEWQRVRPGDGFFADVTGEARYPDYASLAPLIHKANVGNFFWSLMLRPASELHFRRQGVVNGLFHEDGAVWNLDDARAIKAMSGDPSFDGTERKEYPQWMAAMESSTVPVTGPRPR
ncbi:glycoside hydrolase [Haladaptatus sp. AB618]|uniref:glycoside hydrolase n=1 Tax=Haladaptatus sp. AB618 TaxID=2934173 RepID=UPI00209C130F|nr:glycoside hydrolase [Haladaptatus sp. AB618]MCO8256726.1 glycoside hydrolase [Haladaptatus sp. AB618]